MKKKMKKMKKNNRKYHLTQNYMKQLNLYVIS